MKRVAEFEEKTGCYYSPRRLVSDIELWDRSLEIADSCSLLGNNYVLSTFPREYRDKISLVQVSASAILQTRKKTTQTLGREFVWFFGSGLVHKGLDLVLEEFSRRPSQVLHVVGDIESEPDFYLALRHLLSLPNIIVHGRLDPAHSCFAEKLRNVFCFIAPSCAEGTSTAAVTCLQYGFFPILSAQTGVSLPNGSGIVLSDLSAEAIGKAIDAVCQMTDTEVRRQTDIVQRFALENHSRESFRKTMEDYLVRCLL